MKRLYILFLTAVIGLASLSAQRQVEYFWDTDPGPGQGQVLQTFTESTATLSAELDVGDLSAGIHCLGLRAWNDGYFSATYYRTFYVPPMGEQVTRIEYGWDTPPAPGKGKPLSFNPGSTIELTQQLLVEGLSAGLHTIYIRALSTNHQSATYSRTFYVLPTVHTVQAVEYFFDDDPGVGNGMQVAATMTESQLELALSIDTEGLSDGIHHIGLRTLTDGTWSETKVRQFLVRSSVDVDDYITRLEYFWNDDPGQGRGQSVDITPGKEVSLDFEADMNGLSDGTHTLGLRAMSGSKAWSETILVGDIEYVGTPAEAYAVVSTDGTTLSFYYDNQMSSREGTVYTSSNFRSDSNNGWASSASTITTVTFDPAFADYNGLTSTSWWFSGMSSLSAINGLEYLNTSNVTDMSYMFRGCSSLTSLDLTNFDSSSVTTMRSMFENCSSLVNLVLEVLSTPELKDMGFMFSECNNLASLNLLGFDSSKVTSMYRMFYNCKSLSCLDMTGFDTSKVTNMPAMFSNCKQLTTIYVGEGWSTDIVNSSGSMFYNCTNLVGGDGTTYDANYTDKTKAYAGRGGYLTLKLEDDLQYYLNSLTDTEDSFEDGVYTRQFLNWDWQALYVPFSMDYSDWQARFDMASIGHLSTEDGVYYLNASIMEEGSTVQPNTPYLIRAKAKAASRLKVTPDDVVDEEESVFALQNTMNMPDYFVAKITGVYTTQPFWYRPGTDADVYNYRMRGGALSIPEHVGEVLPSNRWYLTLDSRVQPSQVRVRIVDGEPLGIVDLKADETGFMSDDRAVYDLLGRQLNVGQEGMSGLRKGLYIINKKKRIVK